MHDAALDDDGAGHCQVPSLYDLSAGDLQTGHAFGRAALTLRLEELQSRLPLVPVLLLPVHRVTLI